MYVNFDTILDWADGYKLQINVFVDFDNDKIKKNDVFYQKNTLHEKCHFYQKFDTFSSSWHSKQMFEVIPV